MAVGAEKLAERMLCEPGGDGRVSAPQSEPDGYGRVSGPMAVPEVAADVPAVEDEHLSAEKTKEKN